MNNEELLELINRKTDVSDNKLRIMHEDTSEIVQTIQERQKITLKALDRIEKILAAKDYDKYQWVVYKDKFLTEQAIKYEQVREVARLQEIIDNK